jgi:glucan phosphoethanolaminetransferase (alkaline phosphatase superfamily)
VKKTLQTAARWAWRWRWILALNAFLLSPIFAYDLRVGEGGPNKAVIFTLASSVLTLLVVQLLVRRIWILHAVLFPLYLTVATDLFVIAQYKTRLGASMILLIIENMSDAHDFIQGDLKRVLVSVLLLLGGYGYALWRIRELRVTLPRWLALVPTAGLLVVYGGAARYLGGWATVMLHDHSSPFGVLAQGRVTWVLQQEEFRSREASKSFHFMATRAEVPQEPETYVLVVGESARRHNWSLYGYARETNPLLSKTENLVVFKDVITQVAHTQRSVPLIVTRGRVDDVQRTANEKSILAAFSEVGFRTHWLSTQQRDTSTGQINRYPSEADVARFFEHRHDVVLTETMKEMLASPAEKGKKVFYVLHSLGSHFNLTSRYPRSFAKFPDGEGSSLMGGASAAVGHTALINAYDNTILYTDYFLAETIKALREQPGIKALLYVPDHGDNLRDDNRDLFGHAHSNEYDLPIPMLMWFSDEYIRRYPEKVAAAKRNADRRLNTRVVFYTVADLAGISLPDPQLPQFSVVSPTFQDYKRITAGEPQMFDFDEWLARTGLKIPVVTPPEASRPATN